MNAPDLSVSFPKRLAAIAAKKPESPAISFGDKTLTWRSLDLESNRIAHSLKAFGVQPGDLVTLALQNGLHFFAVTWGIWKVGATPQPVSSRLPLEELRKIIEVAKSSLVVTEDEFSGLENATTLSALMEKTGEHAPLSDQTSPSWKAPTSGGSTGRPKVIRCTIPAEYSEAVERSFRLSESDISLIPAPLYHNAPFVLATRALLAGSHVIIVPRFDALTTLELIEEYKVSFLYVVPTMMSRIAKLPSDPRQHDMSSLKTVWHMAEPCPIWLKEYWIDWLGGEKIWEIYAATEGVASAQINGIEWLEHKGSVGKVAPPKQIRAFSAEGEMLPPMEVGELFLHPGENGNIPYEYLGAPANERSGWHSMGDIGYVDEDGYLYLCDRRADMIIVGGVNIYPAEIESAILSHPEVHSTAVIGLPCEDRGKRIHAIVQTKLSEETLKQYLANKLVKYKTPHSFELVDYSLRDDAGKVRRSQLVAERAPK